jgi:hypothetical protein
MGPSVKISDLNSAQTNLRNSRWVWIAGIWLGLGFFSATGNYIFMRVNGMKLAWTRSETFIGLLFIWLPWALAVFAGLRPQILFSAAGIFHLVQTSRRVRIDEPGFRGLVLRSG